MENTTLFENFFDGDLILCIPSNDLIPEDIEVLKESLLETGAKFKVGSFLSRSLGGNPAIILKNQEGLSLSDTAIILDGLDKMPALMVLEKIANIVSIETGTEKIATIVWKGGGSTNIDSKYYVPLKKYWLKKYSVICGINCIPQKYSILEELAKLENFTNILGKFTDARVSKNVAEKNQNYATAGEFRDKEKDLLLILENYFSSYISTKLPDFLQQVLSE